MQRRPTDLNIAGAIDLSTLAKPAAPCRADQHQRARLRRHRARLRGDRPPSLAPGAGPRRLLGRVVRTVQDAQPDPREAGRGGRRLLGARQGRRRQQPGAVEPAADPVDPHRLPRPRRPAGARLPGRVARARAARLPGTGDGGREAGRACRRRGRCRMPVEPPADPDIVAAEEALAAGSYDAALAAYRPGPGAAARRCRGARSAVPGRRCCSGLRTWIPAVGRSPPLPTTSPAQLAAADVEVLSDQIQAAIDRLLDLVRRTAGDDRDRARQHLLELFSVLDPDDERIVQGRRALTNALY